MTDFTGRDLHMIKRALAVCIAALERAPRSTFVLYSDIADMKQLLGELIPSDVELEMITRSARVALTGEHDH